MKKILLFIVFATSFLDCKKKEVNPDFPINFQFRLLDANNQVSTVIKGGENFKISFLMINTSESPYSFRAISLDNIDSFFQVNKMPSNISLNRPFINTFCTDIDPSIKPKDTLKIEIPWVPDSTKRYPFLCGNRKDQKNLEKGNYSTSFSATLGFQKGFTFENISIEKHFKIDFLIN